ncbi:unnamed protein product [Rangifer tarandus platyrhynchus]|uniref:Secreted protein n=1 Tax=Rangifer tarandus platyrhynchus TaxID=3082113 RepID=A0ABN8ZKM0_RANTA|nr:unnamed protein product [Rangifer tarandus platyrhynchus]
MCFVFINPRKKLVPLVMLLYKCGQCGAKRLNNMHRVVHFVVVLEVECSQRALKPVFCTMMLVTDSRSWPISCRVLWVLVVWVRYSSIMRKDRSSINSVEESCVERPLSVKHC